MATLPRRWPAEVEEERGKAIVTANDVTQSLAQAQTTLDTARQKVPLNQGLALVLMADTDRYLADAATRIERVRRHMAIVRGKPVHGRWPMVALRQREDAEGCLDMAHDLLVKAEQKLEHARDRIAHNPLLAEAIIADVSTLQARALTQMERFARLLTEAGMGRE
ncbi:hypothetical protein [Candidatus Oscillochloris fontis]|uniref:hypothetical protein n=1 Tax=Candidatus Oscillochloris fontis TaxID=2496868 RepID=UPI00101C7177|nr:hypothetical protein [Candidatus Oscillochloris fontis]